MGLNNNFVGQIKGTVLWLYFLSFIGRFLVPDRQVSVYTFTKCIEVETIIIKAILAVCLEIRSTRSVYLDGPSVGLLFQSAIESSTNIKKLMSHLLTVNTKTTYESFKTDTYPLTRKVEYCRLTPVKQINNKVQSLWEWLIFSGTLLNMELTFLNNRWEEVEINCKEYTTTSNDNQTCRRDVFAEVIGIGWDTEPGKRQAGLRTRLTDDRNTGWDRYSSDSSS